MSSEQVLEVEQGAMTSADFNNKFTECLILASEMTSPRNSAHGVDTSDMDATNTSAVETPRPPEQAPATVDSPAKRSLPRDEVTVTLPHCTLRVPGHVPRGARRYRCKAPNGRYLIRWDQDGFVLSVVLKPIQGNSSTAAAPQPSPPQQQSASPPQTTQPPPSTTATLAQATEPSAAPIRGRRRENRNSRPYSRNRREAPRREASPVRSSDHRRPREDRHREDRRSAEGHRSDRHRARRLERPPARTAEAQPQDGTNLLTPDHRTQLGLVLQTTLNLLGFGSRRPIDDTPNSAPEAAPPERHL
ncbi:ELL-associated factor 1-like [Ceratina calcarata]|uniref:ELL-associated factor 1-like n=1 Tax=Ceratina calcarata TaxID=156304 RepID=A0AAJ7NDW9_9HYME|nr:ELL-associated factor 1-like [Ceratina calcarata]